jgi:hypothetical protein
MLGSFFDMGRWALARRSFGVVVYIGYESPKQVQASTSRSLFLLFSMAKAAKNAATSHPCTTREPLKLFKSRANKMAFQTDSDN